MKRVTILFVMVVLLVSHLATTEAKDEVDVTTPLKYRYSLGWVEWIRRRPAQYPCGVLPEPRGRWIGPSVMDEELVEDYKLFIDETSKHGFNGIKQWGLLAGQWHVVDDQIVISKERQQMVKEISDYAKSKGIRMMVGIAPYRLRLGLFPIALSQLSMLRHQPRCSGLLP